MLKLKIVFVVQKMSDRVVIGYYGYGYDTTFKHIRHYYSDKCSVWS